MVRKRVILLGITLGLIVNQFMLYQCNKAISAPNYSYTPVDSSYTSYNNLSNCKRIFNGKCLDNGHPNTQQKNVNQNNNYYGGQYVQPVRYNVSQKAVERLSMADYLAGRTGENSYAQQYIDMQRRNYNTAMANRVGVPYEEYICQGNFQCIQQMYMNEQQTRAINNYANALRNQNVNVWGSVDMNHYYRY